MMSEVQHMEVVKDDEIDLRELFNTVFKHKNKLITFILLMTILSILWSFSKPNEYQSQSILVSQEETASRSLGGLNALAGMAGVEIGGGSLTPDQTFQYYVDDYAWMRKFLLESGLFARLNAEQKDKNYKFAMGYSGFYNFLKHSSKPHEENDELREKTLFESYRLVKNRLAISADKKTTAITLTYTDPDAELARDILNAFLKKASETTRQNDMNDIDKKLDYYTKELEKTTDVSLKTQLSQLMSTLIQKKVLAQSTEFYNIKMVTKPEIAYVRDKVGPKRGLIVLVTAISSLIVGIFGIFILEFLRKDK